ncbi:MAG: InlB B-repeat-containing protein [Candidatus Methanoplasma sp.]|jgi:hypothetical protein|nr:InlB B-repeat-containing protein [Candidatus Methanoplasma sp.]
MRLKSFYIIAAPFAVLAVALVAVSIDSSESDAANYQVDLGTKTLTAGQTFEYSYSSLAGYYVVGWDNAEYSGSTNYTWATGFVDLVINGITYRPNPGISGTAPASLGTYNVSFSSSGSNVTFSVTLSIIVNSLGTVQINSDASITVNVGTAVNYTPATTPSADIAFGSSTPLPIYVGNQKTIMGTLVNVLPGTYYVTLLATKSGYASAAQILSIIVPVYVLDPVTDVVQTDIQWTYQVTMIPSSAQITSYVVQKGGTTVTSGFSISTNTRTISATFFETGQFHIFLTIGATGYSSTSKELILEVTAPPEIPQPPTLSSILTTPSDTYEGIYYFTAIGAQNYTSIDWDFGDGTVASGTNVVHRYYTSGEFTPTVRLYNSNNNLFYTENTSVFVVITVMSRADAWATVPYSYAIAIDDALDHVLSTDIGQSWLSLSDITDSGQRWIILSGTPHLALADTTLEVTISNYGTWTIYIWPKFDDSNVTVGFTVDIEGYVVTLTNIGSSGPGVVMFVDWGTTNLLSGTQRQPGTQTAVAEYAEQGAYPVKMILIINGEEFPHTAFITVPSDADDNDSFTLSYDPNGGLGEMPSQIGSSVVILGNSFLNVEGIEFMHWNTKSGGNGINYNPGDTVALTNSITLYAIWSDTDLVPPGDADDDGDGLGIWIIPAVLALIFLVIGLRYRPSLFLVPFCLCASIILWVW